jgi:nucleoside-diphosphate-sugar epimerase
MKRIFITGASGCIGHYLAEALIQQTEHELFFLVRNPDKLQFNYKARPGITIVSGDLREIEQFSDLLKTVDIAILAATSWGGITESVEINVVKTLRLMELLDPELCEQVIYFSTASILDRNNHLLKEAGELGTYYISTKHDCYSKLSDVVIAPKITTVFPTLVLGGDQNKPYSHLSGGLPDVIKWMDLIRWFQADGSFHFIHAQDIAQVVTYLVDSPLPDSSPKQLVLGNQRTTVNEAIAEICAYLNKKIYVRIPLYIWLANIFIKVFRLRMAAWDKFCLNYRHFTYTNPVTPATFGLKNYCTTLSDVLRVTGIPKG